MDTLYLLRFNSKSTLDCLIDEQASLTSQITDFTQDLRIAFAELSYSRALKLNSQLASLKAKLSYINRQVYQAQEAARLAQKSAWTSGWYADQL